MDRREFMQKAAMLGLGVISAPLLSKQAQAQAAPYDGPFWIFVNANGGWDPTDVCDPKGRASETSRDFVNTYLTGDIVQQGNLTFAPHLGHAEFLAKYGSRMMIIRGIDLSTNGHGEGLRHSFSGRLPDGNPSLAALIAATHAPQVPTSFLTAGGYDSTNGLVGATRIGNPSVLQTIAFPNQIAAQNRNGEMTKRNFHDDGVDARVEKYRAERWSALMGKQRLQRVRTSINELYTAGLDQGTLKKVSEFMPNPLSNDRFESQVQIAMAAYKAGATISMSMGFGSFDTHGNHDANHIPQMQALLTKIDFLWNEADRLGIADKVSLMLSSEMGRTPHYNSGNGKDHWSTTSAILMGPGIPGNRVIGATNEGVEPMRINPDTLEVLGEKDPNGVLLTPAIVHQALRTKAGVREDYQRDFPIYPEKPVDLFRTA